VNPPKTSFHNGVFVVRDDLFPGGTKARFLPHLFEGADEVVYASPAEGGAQTALAHVAKALGKRATIFVAKRAKPHNRAFEAKRVGAKVLQVRPGYLTVVQSRAREYCRRTGARLIPFGVNMPYAIEAISAAARAVDFDPDEVWCAAGSGVLSRGLSDAWPDANINAVQVGRGLTAKDVAGAKIHIHRMKFRDEARNQVPFPCDPHYDAKAWDMCMTNKGIGKVLFWNVTGPAQP